MPRRIRRPSKGRTVGGDAGRRGRGSAPPAGAVLLRATPRDDAIVDLVRRQVLEGARRQLLLLGGGAVARELIEETGKLGGDENAQVLVRGVLGDFGRSEDSHVIPVCSDGLRRCWRRGRRSGPRPWSLPPHRVPGGQFRRR